MKRKALIFVLICCAASTLARSSTPVLREDTRPATSAVSPLDSGSCRSACYGVAEWDGRAIPTYSYCVTIARYVWQLISYGSTHAIVSVRVAVHACLSGGDRACVCGCALVKGHWLACRLHELKVHPLLLMVLQKQLSA